MEGRKEGRKERKKERKKIKNKKERKNERRQEKKTGRKERIITKMKEGKTEGIRLNAEYSSIHVINKENKDGVETRTNKPARSSFIRMQLWLSNQTQSFVVPRSAHVRRRSQI